MPRYGAPADSTRDPDHPCPHCKADTEVTTITMTRMGSTKEDIISRSRQCTDPECEGRKGLPHDDPGADGLEESPR